MPADTPDAEIMHLPSGSPAFRVLLSGRGLLVVAVLICAVGLAGIRAVQHQIAQRAVQSAELSARLVTSLTVRRNLALDANGTPVLSPAAREDMNSDVEELEKRSEISGLEVWAADGRLLFADAGHPPDEQTMPADELTRALGGEPYTIYNDDEGRGHRTLDVFLPIDVQGDGAVDVVVESLLPRDPINDAITRSMRALYAGAAVAVLLAGAWLLRLRRRHLSHQHAATHDPLTGLGNRTLLAHRAAQVLGADRDHNVALLLIDLDGFKEVNDVLGHHVGDELLVAVGRALAAAGRDSDTVVRLGGDEFAVLIAATPGSSAAVQVAKHLLEALREPVVIGGVTVEADGSIGVALAPEHGSDLSALLRCADVAMYQAKRQGSDISVYDPETDPHEAQQLNLLAELRRAIPNGELELYYQPKAPMAGPVNEVEALIRWNHPHRGLLPPAAFMPLVERTSLIGPLTHWVLHEAARQCAVWQAKGLDLRIAVNVSPRNLLDDDLPSTVLDAATAAGIAASALQIEITETAVMADPQRVKNIVERLHSMGVLVAIDDFGAGYTSLSYLKTLAAKSLKIDRGFITHLLDHAADEAVVRNVIHLAHDLGMSIVAEGVETPAVWAKLSELGCDEIQGYVLTPPVPADKIVTWLADHTDTNPDWPASEERPSTRHATSPA
jgi:diguanylate cyclase (GGDEF)-like protein